MIWQVFDLIRTRRTPAHSYTQTIMCVCVWLAWMFSMSESNEWQTNFTVAMRFSIHPQLRHASPRFSQWISDSLSCILASLAFGISLLVYVPFRFSINEIDLVEHEILLALELACFLCNAKLFAGFAFCCFSSAFLSPGCKLSYEEGCWRGWRGISVNEGRWAKNMVSVKGCVESV